MLALPLLALLGEVPPYGEAPPPPPWPPPAAEVAAPTKPRRVELLARLGIAAGASSWRGDALGYGSLELGLRLFRALTVFGMARMGYAPVDERILTMLSLGLEGGYPIRGRYWPYVRLGFVHQHEESVAAAAADPLATPLGIGTGIRHRAGLQAGVGCDFVLRGGRRGDVTLGPEVTVAYLSYSSGPQFYGLVGLQAGGSLALF